MKRAATACALSVSVLALTGPPLLAEAKTREKTQVKFEGMLGRMVGMLGGKAAKEGLVSTSAVSGDRKATFTDATGRIVDLGEEKIYDLDMKKKTYKVTTFEELRRQIREAQEKAARDAEKQPVQNGERPSGAEVEIDFDLKETGHKKAIAGFDAHEIIMTVTVREKGRTLEEGGGLVMTTDSWLGPRIPALQELADFERRYWKAIAPETSGVSAEQMAALMTLYPMVKQAMDRMAKENVKLEGTPLATTMTFEAVKSQEQMTQQARTETGGGGLGGMLARRVMKRDDKPRATIFSADTETLEVATTVAPADVQIPAGFKETNQP